MDPVPLIPQCLLSQPFKTLLSHPDIDNKVRRSSKMNLQMQLFLVWWIAAGRDEEKMVEMMLEPEKEKQNVWRRRLQSLYTRRVVLKMGEDDGETEDEADSEEGSAGGGRAPRRGQKKDVKPVSQRVGEIEKKMGFWVPPHNRVYYTEGERGYTYTFPKSHAGQRRARSDISTGSGDEEEEEEEEEKEEEKEERPPRQARRRAVGSTPSSAGEEAHTVGHSNSGENDDHWDDWMEEDEDMD